MTRPTVWIAGGTDKGNDYDVLKPLAERHVKALVCMGVDNAKLIRDFTGIVPVVYDTHSLDEAMRVCTEQPNRAIPSCFRPRAPVSTSSGTTRSGAGSSRPPLKD